VCAQCRRGHFVACTDQPRTGITVDGGYAEYLYARQSGLVSIPEQLSSIDASPLLCAGFTTYNALLKAQLKPGDLAGVQGIGGLGHLGVQYARKMGATVVAIAVAQPKRPWRATSERTITSTAAPPMSARSLRNWAVPMSSWQPPQVAHR